MRIGQRYYLITIIALGVALLMAGCSRTESENVTSRGIHADIEVAAGGNSVTEVEVELKVGNGISGTLLELSGGDRLLAHANGITQQLGKDEDLFGIKYITSFNFNDASSQFRIEFERSEAVSAPNSVVSLPLPPNITMPASGDIIAAGADLTVAWEPAFTPDSMRVRFITKCHGSNGSYYSREVIQHPRDTGSYTINTSEFSSVDPVLFHDVTNCDLDVTVFREKRGTLDPNYGEGGRIVAIQRRTVIVQLAINPSN
ncbi:hypothetical protein [Kaarinaea lacus]